MGVTVPCRMAMTEKGIYRDIHLDVYFIVWSLEACFLVQNGVRSNLSIKMKKAKNSEGGGHVPIIAVASYIRTQYTNSTTSNLLAIRSPRKSAQCTGAFQLKYSRSYSFEKHLQHASSNPGMHN